jgi:uncharacterized protein
VASPSHAPIRPDERLFSLDALRGVALLGVFLMNIPAFAHSVFHDPATLRARWRGLDAAVGFARDLLVAGRFNILFALLFGIGIHLQWSRIAARAGPAQATTVSSRRLAGLLAIGLAHSLGIWSGDVLTTYAVLGALLLLVLRGAPDPLLLGAVVLGALLPSLDLALRPLFLGDPAAGRADGLARALVASNDAAFGSGSIAEAWRENAKALGWFYGTSLGVWSIALFVSIMGSGLVLGFWLARSGHVATLGAFVDAAADSATDARLARLQWAALGAALALPLLGLSSAGQLALTLLYATAIVRLAARRRGRAVLAPFAAVGRMPLTNYLAQSVVATLLFHGWALGLYDRTGPAAEVAIGVGVFVFLQMPISAWWLRRHANGPVEWVWRWMTYGVGRRA